MLPKSNLKSNFLNYYNQIFLKLSSEIKLPITDISIKTYNKTTLNGQFCINIDEDKKIILDFKYEENTFNWDIKEIEVNIDSIWPEVFKKHKDTIKIKISNKLHLTFVNNEYFTTGIRNIIYLYQFDNSTPITIVAEYTDNDWNIFKI